MQPPPPAATANSAPRRGSTIALATALALVAGFGGGFVGAQVGDNSSNSAATSSLLTAAPASVQSAPAPAGSVQEVADKVLPSTVSVLASSERSFGEGSGIILTADGLILTNNHVIAGATDLQVRFNDGTTAAAEVVGSDSVDDLAVLRAQGVSGLTPGDARHVRRPRRRPARGRDRLPARAVGDRDVRHRLGTRPPGPHRGRDQRVRSTRS